MAERKVITVAIAGNPNAGKTTIFNHLTGARQHVGNYPGVTVEKKEGLLRRGDIEIRVIDLPGTYSLTAYSVEELIARNVVLEEKPDVVVDVVDASNLERNLYLAVQFMELGVPLVLAFNMSDIARARGMEIDTQKLSRLLGCPIVSTVGHRGLGINALVEAIVKASRESMRPVQVRYGHEIETEIKKLQDAIMASGLVNLNKYPARWLAVKLLEGDSDVLAKVPGPIAAASQGARNRIENFFGDPPEVIIAEQRYGFISGACQQCVRRANVEARHNLSDRIDSIVTHRVLAIPIFLAFMYGVFYFTFALGDPLADLGGSFFALLAKSISNLWPPGVHSSLQSLIVDGIIAGVGNVLVFMPNILFLFLAIAVLEDSGYMARAAFIMDKVMHRIGLHGKSFIPLLLGFGCTIPAIMATRTLENRRDRLTTILVAPLMSCGARLPIYALIIPAFFPRNWQAPVLWSIYLIGIILAVVSAKLLRSTLFRGEAEPFVMELPPYRLPTLKSLLLHMWERSALYLRKAGTIILGLSVLLWAMSSYPEKPGLEQRYAAEVSRVKKECVVKQLDPEECQRKVAELEHSRQSEALEYSLAGRVGRALEPLVRPMGFDWRIATALVGATAAKEVFVAQMGIMYSIGESDEESEELRTRLRENYSALVGFCIMLFCLISAPCVATIAVTRQESGSWKWAVFQFTGLTLLAYVITTVVYQVGRALVAGG